MNIRQKLLTIIEQLSEDKLATLLKLAVFLTKGKESVQPMLVSQAYQDWLSVDNDIYDELFANEFTVR